ncbi:thiomuracin/GE37468 family thiazolyl RiPP peptide [Nonomuraea sp. NPDC049714]|jgi:hypothetical protein|uniref:thiomuracin/GE37468 family thiazolyl RiPP peptide n=1 Tax=unclassified Nonomuraea TaxID=2593643 RepID=UPI0037AEE9F6
MQESSLFDLSALTVESISVMAAAPIEGVSEGHGMTELSASRPCTCACACPCNSSPSFVEDDVL